MSGTRRRPGRLGPFVDGYRVWLLEAGYTPQTVRAMLKDLGSLGRWMDVESVEVGALTVTAIESFLAAGPDGSGVALDADLSPRCRGDGRGATAQLVASGGACRRLPGVADR